MNELSIYEIIEAGVAFGIVSGLIIGLCVYLAFVKRW